MSLKILAGVVLTTLVLSAPALAGSTTTLQFSRQTVATVSPGTGKFIPTEPSRVIPGDPMRVQTGATAKVNPTANLKWGR
jgi:hypothetical protein